MRMFLPLLAVLACCARPADAASNPVQSASAGRLNQLEVQTVPRLSGIAIPFRGRLFYTNSRGVVQLPAAAAERLVRPSESAVRPGVRAVFARWKVSPNSRRAFAIYDLYYLVHLRFADLAARPIDPSAISMIELRSSIGARKRIRREGAIWLLGRRIVTGGIRTRDVGYRVQRVIVAGTNVVNRGQQRFYPSQSRNALLRLLFFRVRFFARDALFGRPAGSRLRITFPDGHVERSSLGRDGTLTRPSLPRGDYKVAVEGGGISLGGPLSLSRNSDLVVTVVSYVDMGVVVAVAMAFALGLPLARRPLLRARIGRYLRAMTIRRRAAIYPGGRRR
jgi:hypothetical protein